MTRNLLVRVLASIAAVVVLSGCGDKLKDPYTPASKEDIAHAEAMMRKLPSVETAERDLAAMIQRIADAAKTVAPELVWTTKVDRAMSTLGCPSPYLETDGVSMTTDTLFSSVPVSDAQWPDVVKVARDIAAEGGITALTVFADVPGDHDITLHSPDHGNEIRIGSRKAAVLSAVTGCRYREEDLRKQPAN